MSKVHFYQFRQSAWDAYDAGIENREVAANQTACGYVREEVTKIEDEVTCRLCKRRMKRSRPALSTTSLSCLTALNF